MTMLPAILTIEGGVYLMAVLVIPEQYIQNSDLAQRLYHHQSIVRFLCLSLSSCPL